MENNTYAVVITKIPGGSQPVLCNGTETIADLFAKAFAGESVNGYQIQVNGEAKDSTYVPRNGENITCAKMIKGN